MNAQIAKVAVAAVVLLGLVGTASYLFFSPPAKKAAPPVRSAPALPSPPTPPKGGG